MSVIDHFEFLKKIDPVAIYVTDLLASKSHSFVGQDMGVWDSGHYISGRLQIDLNKRGFDPTDPDNDWDMSPVLYNEILDRSNKTLQSFLEAMEGNILEYSHLIHISSKRPIYSDPETRTDLGMCQLITSAIGIKYMDGYRTMYPAQGLFHLNEDNTQWVESRMRSPVEIERSDKIYLGWKDSIHGKPKEVPNYSLTSSSGKMKYQFGGSKVL